MTTITTECNAAAGEYLDLDPAAAIERDGTTVTTAEGTVIEFDYEGGWHHADIIGADGEHIDTLEGYRPDALALRVMMTVIDIEG